MDRFGRQRRSRSHDSHRSRDSHRSGKNRDSQPRAYSGAFRNAKARSRSRSRGKSNRRSRSRDRRRSRSRDRRSRRRRSSSSSSSSSSSDRSMKRRTEEQQKQDEEQRKKEQESLAARVFVSNLPFGQFTEGDLRHMLDNHGKLKEVNAFIERGYAFLQFDTEADARRAVDESRGSIWKGRNIDIKMALEGRRGGDGYNRRPSPPVTVTPPLRPTRDRSPIRDDRYLPRDPYIRDREPPLRRDDPYYDDPYRRPLPPDDPYLDRLRDDRYRGLPPPPPRRDPYADPYRDLPPQRPIPPPECTVLLAEEQVRPYGEVIIRKVKAAGLVASIAVLPEDRTVQQAVEDMTRRGTLFAIVITAQNEVHSSVTLNILHGQPQEHRNMPLDDAMSLVARSFDRYMQTSREKAAAPTPAPPVAAAPRSAAVVPFMLPDSGISYLLNLLADNRQLTLTELDKVITYLTERRSRLRGDDPVTEAAPAVASARPAVIPRAEDATSKAKQQEAAAIQQRQDLQAKILNLFNGDSSKANPSMASALLSLQGQAAPSLPSVQAAQVPAAPPGGAPNSALINFDNPSVQKALDSLIQNPQVLQNIASVSGPTVGMNTPTMMGMGSQHTHGQAGVAHTSLATGSRQQPGYRGEPPHMQVQGPYGGMPQGNQAARYHHPY